MEGEMMGEKEYTISGNPEVLRLVEECGYTYTQARRWVMHRDGMSLAEIAKAEGISRATAQDTVEAVRFKMVTESKGGDAE
jgi:transposase